MNSQLTFGKYKGSTPAQLKRVDPDYLKWGAANLSSPKWRAEFQQALATITDEDNAWAMVRSSGGEIDFEEAFIAVRDERLEAEENDRKLAACEKAMHEIAAKWAPIFGKTPAQIAGVIHRCEMDWQDAPASQFSSNEAYQNFRAMMAENDAATSAIWKG
jgi:hypothetical protein